jgi:hypothetical protein
LTYAVLGSVSRLVEMVYALAGHVVVELRKDLIKVPFDHSPPAANTRSATPRKDQAQTAKDKSKKVDKGKGKIVEPEKPKKVVYPIQTGGVFKIREPRLPSPPVLPIASLAKKSPLVEKKNIGVPPKVV